MFMKRLAAALAGAVMFGTAVFSAGADASEELSPTAESVYVCAVSGSGVTAIYEQNADEQLAAGHLAKLMMVLMCAESIAAGELGEDDIVTVSAAANSKQGAQIWLDAGEKIAVSELLKAVIIGNANDACTALAETLCGSEEEYVKAANERAEKLGMKGTRFADCCGMSADTVTTARDMGLMAAEIAGHEYFKDYFTTWIDTVRGGRAELVSTNRLIRSYKGILGLKACGGELSGECICAAAKRGELTACAVLIDCGDSEGKLGDARALLDFCFQNYCVFTPEIDKKYLADIPVTGGEKQSVKVKALIGPAVVTGAQRREMQSEIKVEENAEAPIKRGDVLGTAVYSSDGEQLLSVDIVAAEDVRKISWGFAVKRCLWNLLNMT